MASNHAAKGWLEAERGNVMVARDALNKATAVEPNYAFPWVVKGVLLAREGKFAEAVEMWKKARSIEPSYPNIDQLIAEAEKAKVADWTALLQLLDQRLGLRGFGEFGSTAITLFMISIAPAVSAFCRRARPILKSGLPQFGSMSTARWYYFTASSVSPFANFTSPRL